MPKLLILGPTGNVGSSIQSHLSNLNQEFEIIDRSSYDLTDYNSIKRLMMNLDSGVVLNCVAFMSADNCETNPEISLKVNYEFPAVISQIISDYTSCKLIQLSTDFVFDGKDRDTPYLPSDSPKPINTYGKHKAQAEEAILNQLGARARILRISSFVGQSSRKTTFLERIARQLVLGKKPQIVDDLTISVSSAGLLSLDVMRAFQEKALIQHSANPGSTTWFKLAEYFMNKSGSNLSLDRVSVRELSLIAPRPKYSVLSASTYFTNDNREGWMNAIDYEHFSNPKK